MPSSLKQRITQTLQGLFYLSLGVFVLSSTWNTGWHVVGDPYSLGPYLPWLELVFPFSGLGLWGLFFTQWALGGLREIHLTRWFYLLLFISLLMVNVLFSSNAESSLGWLSIWLTGSLMLSLQFKTIFKNPYFWIYYALSLGLSLALWYLYPRLINPELLLFATWFAALHAWYQTTKGRWRYGLSMATCILGWLLHVALGLQLLVGLIWIGLWWKEYKPYRRKSLRPWYGALGSLGLFIGFAIVPNFSLQEVLFLPSSHLGSNFSWWYGVGWGQLEWAQYLAQTDFQSIQALVTDLRVSSRWWYETGLLMLLLVPSLWLLTVGHEHQSLKFRTILFWSITLLAPTLWFSPGGIVLGCFWFFNRSAWQSANQLLSVRTPKSVST